MLLINLRTKHLFFWIGVLAVAGASWLTYQTLFAEIDFGSQSVLKEELTIGRTGQVKLAGRNISSALSPGNKTEPYDEFFYKIFENLGQNYQRMEFKVILPAGVSAADVRVHPILTYTDIPQAAVSYHNNEIMITGHQIGPQALFSLRLFIPKGIIRFPWYKQLSFKVIGQGLLIWLILSLIFPLTAILSFVVLALKRNLYKNELKTNQQINAPPSNLSPALISILYQNRITPAVITAQLLDMANRGLIEVVFKDDKFSFGRLSRQKQNSINQSLTPAEQVIISKIFRPGQFKAEEKEIKFRAAHRLFSQKIALFYYLLFNQAYNQGYFTEEPAGLHQHYRNWGLGIFLVGLVGLIGTLMSGPEPLIFPWLGTVLAGVLFVRYSSSVSFLSPKGIKELRGWLAFRDFLLSGDLGDFQRQEELFGRYLAYAVALGCEKEWLARFQKRTFQPPTWFVSFENVPSREAFVVNILGMLDWLSHSLTYAKDPSLD